MYSEFSARITAIKILDSFKFHGPFYFKMEDWLTKQLQGDFEPAPKELAGEYLKCALRLEVEDYAPELDDEDIEDVVHRIINSKESILNLELIEDMVSRFVDEKHTIPLEVQYED